MFLKFGRNTNPSAQGLAAQVSGMRLEDHPPQRAQPAESGRQVHVYGNSATVVRCQLSASDDLLDFRMDGGASDAVTGGQGEASGATATSGFRVAYYGDGAALSSTSTEAYGKESVRVQLGADGTLSPDAFRAIKRASGL